MLLLDLLEKATETLRNAITIYDFRILYKVHSGPNRILQQLCFRNSNNNNDYKSNKTTSKCTFQKLLGDLQQTNQLAKPAKNNNNYNNGDTKLHRKYNRKL